MLFVIASKASTDFGIAQISKWKTKYSALKLQPNKS